MIDIFLINLERRGDRLAQCKENFTAAGLDMSAVNVVRAVDLPDFGALGCARSHVHTLATYLSHHDAPYCLVLEDDFDFKRPLDALLSELQQLVQSGQRHDVVLFGGTSLLAYPEGIPEFQRVIESQSTCAYFVARRYVPRLLACFAEAAMQLERFSAARALMYPKLGIDQYWKRLQLEDCWLILANTAGAQRESFSDIELQHVNYAALHA